MKSDISWTSASKRVLLTPVYSPVPVIEMIISSNVTAQDPAVNTKPVNHEITQKESSLSPYLTVLIYTVF